MTKEEIYLKGYRDGFMSAWKLAWALAEEMKMKAIKSNEGWLKEIDNFIKKLKS